MLKPTYGLVIEEEVNAEVISSFYGKRTNAQFVLTFYYLTIRAVSNDTAAECWQSFDFCANQLYNVNDFYL